MNEQSSAPFRPLTEAPARWLGFAWLAFIAAWALAWAGRDPVPAVAVAGLAGLAAAGFGGRAGLVLGVGIGGLVALVLKDLWPGVPGAWTAWARTSGLEAEATWLSVRNPQLGPGLRQAGAIAAGLLGIAALHAAVAAGLLTRRRWLRFLGLLLAGWCVLVLLFTDRDQPYGPGNQLGSITSKNAAGTLAALGAVLAAGLARISARRQHLALAAAWVGAVLLALYVLLGLRSWTGVLAAVVGLAVLGDHALRSRVRLLNRVLWAVTFAAGALVATVVLNRSLAARLATVHDDFRLEIWQDSLALLREFPLGGTGLGSFAGLYPLDAKLPLPADARLAHPDSSWVLLLIEWGPLAVALLLFLWAGRWRRDATHAEKPMERSVSAIVQAGTTAWLVAAATDVSFHRPETLLIGGSLLALGIRPGPARAHASRFGAGLALVAAGLLVAAGQWTSWRLRQVESDPARPPAALLRWEPLSAPLHWRAAFRAWNEEGNAVRAVAHFRAAVLVDHRSLRLAEQVAQLLTGPNPEAARFFWEATFSRGREDFGLGRRALDYALARHPALPDTYWEQVLRASNPELLPLLATRPGAEAGRLLRAWRQAGGGAYLDRSDYFRSLLDAVAAAPGETGLLIEVMAVNRERLPRDAERQAAECLHRMGHAAEAWTLLMGAEPFRTLAASTGPGTDFPGSARWMGLGQALDQAPDRRARRRILEEACAQPGTPAWFHLAWAREIHAEGQAAEAVAHLLALVSAGTGKH